MSISFTAIKVLVYFIFTTYKFLFIELIIQQKGRIVK